MAASLIHTMRNGDRDAEICRRYKAGETYQSLHKAFHLSLERIRQILRQHGVSKDDRDKKRKRSRPRYLGITISVEDKAALKAEAEKKGVSMSELSADMIREKLVSGE